jgi:arylsulfatase A-like enzyme
VLACLIPLASCGGSAPVAFDFAAEVDNAYAFGTHALLDLGTIPVRPYLAEGWNAKDSNDLAEGTWVWGVGERSLVNFRLGPPGELTLRLTGRGYDRSPQIPMPDVTVRINGAELTRLTVSSDWQDFEIDVPATVLRAGHNLLSLDYEFPPDAVAAGELGAGSWLVAWKTIEFDAPDAAPMRPLARTSTLGLPVPSRLQYWVPAHPGAELVIENVDWQGVAPDQQELTLRLILETEPGPIEIDLAAETTEMPFRLEIPVAEPQFVVVEFEVAGAATGDGIAWLRAPQVVGGVPQAAIAPAEPACSDCNILLLSIDTLRADRVGVYDPGRQLTPNIDAFREEAILFRTHIAQAPSTLPSHSSMFTGVVPQRHGASMSNKRQLPEGVLTLAGALSAAGYATAGFTGGAQVDPQWGLDDGFDYYEIGVQSDGPPSPLGRAVPRVREWLEERGEPFFLFLHTYEVHAPYRPRADDYEALTGVPLGGLPDDDPQHVIASYDAGVMEMDRGFAAVIEMLRDLGLYDSTIIVVTSDHGEELGERGHMAFHSHTLNEELLRVPLLIKLEGSRAAGAEFTGVSSSVDLLPSIFTRLGMATPDVVDGTDLFGAREAAQGIAISQIDSQNPRGAPGSIQSRRWKLLAPTYQLRDLAVDPGETQSFAAIYPVVALALQQRYADAVLAPLEAGAGVELTEELAERLRSLGYIQ